jgi:hypothetical protein
VNKKVVWERGKVSRTSDLKTDLAVDSVRLEVKTTGLFVRAITTYSSSNNIETVCCLEFIA